ncbi:hypothetical protein BDQ17DRAFT_1331422 [Cyathus striatus]|nr:hypothetical protein BDQ17DRAFT_1331422 [Cyathus striatus]
MVETKLVLDLDLNRGFIDWIVHVNFSIRREEIRIVSLRSFRGAEGELAKFLEGCANLEVLNINMDDYTTGSETAVLKWQCYLNEGEPILPVIKPSLYHRCSDVIKRPDLKTLKLRIITFQSAYRPPKPFVKILAADAAGNSAVLGRLREMNKHSPNSLLVKH